MSNFTNFADGVDWRDCRIPARASNNLRTMITELEFLQNEERRLTELSNLIRLSGESPRQIAQACRLDKRTVIRAMKRLPLKSDATERIRYYITQTLRQIK